MRICERCGREVQDDASFCPHCGESLAPKIARYDEETIKEKKEVGSRVLGNVSLPLAISGACLANFFVVIMRSYKTFNALNLFVVIVGAAALIAGLIIGIIGLVKKSPKSLASVIVAGVGLFNFFILCAIPYTV